MEPDVVALLDRQHGVAATWQLLELGIEERLRTHVRRGRLVRLRHGVYAQERPADPCAAADLAARAEQLLRRRDEVVVGPSAAAVHGLPVLGRAPVAPRLSLPREAGERPREDRPRSWMPDHHLEERDGLLVTTLARTVVDVARTRPFAFAVVTADAALAAGCDRAEALEVLEQCRRWPGSRSARRVLAFADARSESPLESLGRARFDEHHLPPPELQVDLGGASGQVRVDHYWRGRRTVGEADGLGKYTDLDVLRAEKLREDWLRDRGEEVVRYVWEEALRRPAVLAERITRAFFRADHRAA